MLKLDLKLKPGKAGQAQLQRWPEQELVPDFIVASSGAIRFEFNGHRIITDEGRLVLSPAKSSRMQGWLPDYTGGFALSLGQAALRLKNQAASHFSARFIDEPVELSLAWLNPLNIEAVLKQDGQIIARLETPAGLLLAEIARALQAFYVQLLEINPRLAEQPDMITLNRLIVAIITP